MNLDVSIDGEGAFIEAIDDLQDEFAEPAAFEVYTNTNYAFWQEFGTSYQSGTPHLRPGFRAGIKSLDQFMMENSTRRALMLTSIEITRETMRRAPVDTGHLRASYDWREL